jgi:hypothetical protein
MDKKKNVAIETDNEPCEKGWADSHGKTPANSERKFPVKIVKTVKEEAKVEK